MNVEILKEKGFKLFKMDKNIYIGGKKTWI